MAGANGMLPRHAGLRERTAVHLVCPGDVNQSKTLTLTKFILGVADYFNRLEIPFVFTEVVATVMHNAVYVVALVVGIQVRVDAKCTLVAFSVEDVLLVDPDVLVPVGSLLFVVEADYMAKLMHDDSRRKLALLTQEYRLDPTCTADVRRASPVMEHRKKTRQKGIRCG